jgi:hypothetical protein
VPHVLFAVFFFLLVLIFQAMNTAERIKRAAAGYTSLLPPQKVKVLAKEVCASSGLLKQACGSVELGRDLTRRIVLGWQGWMVFWMGACLLGFLAWFVAHLTIPEREQAPRRAARRALARARRGHGVGGGSEPPPTGAPAAGAAGAWGALGPGLRARQDPIFGPPRRPYRITLSASSHRRRHGVTGRGSNAGSSANDGEHGRALNPKC